MLSTKPKEQPKGTFGTISAHGHVSVYWEGAVFGQRGTASADCIGEGEWWVARVLVQPAEIRGLGIGTQLVEKLKDAVGGKECHRIIVAPGGYDMNTEDQERFYMKLGFVKEKTETGHILVWKPPEKKSTT